MTSENQIRANRDNAQFSTGPRTETGKRCSSANHTTHGLTGRRVVLKSESQAGYDQLLETLRADFAPQSALEDELVHEIANNAWRLRRADRVEADLFDQAAEDFLAISAELDKLRRYRTAIEKAWHKAIDQLRKLQSGRPPAEPPEPVHPLNPMAAFDKALRDCLFAPLPTANGFESQKRGNEEETPEVEEEPLEEDLDPAG